MRLIHPRMAGSLRSNAMTVALAMLVVGGSAVVLMGVLPPTRVAPLALLSLSAALALGVGGAMAWRAVLSLRRKREEIGDDLGRMLAPRFDDAYTLVLAPRLPGVPQDLAGLLIGPAGVRAFVVRRWRGRYRVRGRGWEYDTRSRAGWIPTMTNPSFDADAVVDAVARWTRLGVDDASLPVVGTVAFPRRHSSVVLEEPDGEIVTVDNAPWWAQSIGRVQRLDPRRAARLVEAVLDASEAEASAPAQVTSLHTA